MIVIKNKKEKVIVLKALGNPDLRLFPGHNNVDVENWEELKPYVSSKAAKGLLNGYTRVIPGFQGEPPQKKKIDSALEVVGLENLDSEEKTEAAAAQEKNDILNKSALTIKKQNEQILRQNEDVRDLEKKFEKKLEFQEARIAEILKEKAANEKSSLNKDEVIEAQSKQIDFLISEMKSVKEKMAEAGIK
jgi:hypothetical protein